jgi:hypothetical protein
MSEHTHEWTNGDFLMISMFRGATVRHALAAMTNGLHLVLH